MNDSFVELEDFTHMFEKIERFASSSATIHQRIMSDQHKNKFRFTSPSATVHQPIVSDQHMNSLRFASSSATVHQPIVSDQHINSHRFTSPSATVYQPIVSDQHINSHRFASQSATVHQPIVSDQHINSHRFTSPSATVYQPIVSDQHINSHRFASQSATVYQPIVSDQHINSHRFTSPSATVYQPIVSDQHINSHRFASQSATVHQPIVSDQHINSHRFTSPSATVYQPIVSDQHINSHRFASSSATVHQPIVSDQHINSHRFTSPSATVHQPIVSDQHINSHRFASQSATVHQPIVSDQHINSHRFAYSSATGLEPIVSGIYIDNLRISSLSSTEQPSVLYQTDNNRKRKADVTTNRKKDYRERRKNQEANHDLMLLNLHEEHYLGKMDVVCKACKALLFHGEVQKDAKNGTYSVCCSKGKVANIKQYEDLPMLLIDLLLGTSPQSVEFRKNIRKYNNCFAMASVQATIPSLPGRGPITYKIHGQMYHHIGTLLPTQVPQKRFSQYYILDPSEAAEERVQQFDLRNDSVRELSALMLRKNKFAQSFKMMGDIYNEEKERAKQEGLTVPEIAMTFVNSSELDLRRYNMPTCNEVAVVYIPEEGYSNELTKRGLTIHLTKGGIQRISEFNPLCDPLSYPLMFPQGTEGWSMNMKSDTPSFVGKKITLREYYAYMLFQKESLKNTVFLFGKLFQQYCVDAYVKIEKDRLNFHKTNQDKYRIASMTNLSEFFSDENNNNSLITSKIILPSSYQGGPRAMYTSFLDAMAIVSKFGKPDMFITFTCNPKWKEIQEQLLPWQTAIDRPDVVSRVFKLKFDEFKKDICENNLFGKVASYVSVFEYQKRGLPHVHLLLTLDNGHKIINSEQVDKFISADIPDEKSDKHLYDLVVTHMIHKNCCSLGHKGAPCEKKKNNRSFCSKKFPKQYSDVTLLNHNGFLVYKRSSSSSIYTHNGISYDNRHVVPYNTFLLKKFNAHINVECCALLHAVKYLFKYVYKGPPLAKLMLENKNDEIANFVDGRYLCAPEAVHRIFGFKIEHRSHTVYGLPVHLPHDRHIRVENGNEQIAYDQALKNETMLESWFTLNRNYVGAGLNPKNFFYFEMPYYFTFDRLKGWKERKSGHSKIIGRIHQVSVKNKERFCLRLLLLNKKGCTSFDDLKTINGTLCASFETAAASLGLLKTDDLYEKTMLEAVEIQMPRQLRAMFSCLLGYCDLQNPLILWEKFKYHLSEDFIRHNYPEDIAYAKAYYDLYDRVKLYGLNLNEIIPLPSIERSEIPLEIIDFDSHLREGLRLKETLNTNQSFAFEKISSAVLSNTDAHLFFLDGPGGTGKTYLYNTLYQYLVGSKKKLFAPHSQELHLYCYRKVAHHIPYLKFPLICQMVV